MSWEGLRRSASSTRGMSRFSSWTRRNGKVFRSSSATRSFAKAYRTIARRRNAVGIRSLVSGSKDDAIDTRTSLHDNQDERVLETNSDRFLEGSIVTLLMFPFWLPSTAFAASDGPPDFLTNAGGLVFTVGLAFLLYRLLRKRGKDAVEKQVRSSLSIPEEPVRAEEEYVLPDPLQTFIGGLQAGTFALVLWYLSSHVDDFLSSRPLPSGYTARNIAVTIKTMVLGLCYLATFVFGANSAGLFGLTLQILIQPDKVAEQEMESRRELKARRKKRKEIEMLERELKAAEALLQKPNKTSQEVDLSKRSARGTTSNIGGAGGKGFLNLSRSSSLDDITLDLDLRKNQEVDGQGKE